MKPNIFIVGPSGTGKSSCLRNMDPNTTVILNTERKALPFKGGSKFVANVPIDSVDEWIKNFEIAIKLPEVKVIFTDSFTSLSEMIMAKAEKLYGGYDVFKYFSQEIYNILNMSKNLSKYIVFSGTDMTVEGANGVEERCISILGSWKKKVEKEFVIVLFSEVAEAGDKVEYQFMTNRRNGIPAKSPQGMLPMHVPNDLNMIIESIEVFLNDDNDTPVTETEKKSAN